jgi:hypothetical protein
MGKSKTWHSTGLCFGTFAFLLYINDLPTNIKDKSIPVSYADDTNILLYHSTFIDFTNNSSNFKILNDWFTANLLSSNFSKIHFTYFTTKLNKLNLKLAVAIM